MARTSREHKTYVNRRGPTNLGIVEWPSAKPGCLKGIKFLITGILETIKREDAIQLLMDCGGHVLEGMSKNLDYLIVGRDAGPVKQDKAREWDIQQLNEEEFFIFVKFRVDSYYPNSDIEVVAKYDKATTEDKVELVETPTQSAEDKREPMARCSVKGKNISDISPSFHIGVALLELNYQLPFTMPSFNVIEDNFRQVIQNIQDKVVADSEISGVVENNRNEPEFLKEGVLSDDQCDSQVVVVSKKVKKKNKKTKSIFSQEDAISAATSNTLSSETSSLSSFSGDKTEPAISVQAETIPQVDTDINEDDKLAMILAAFPSENEIEMSLDIRNPPEQGINEHLEITLKPDVISVTVTEEENEDVEVEENTESIPCVGENRLEILDHEALKYRLVIPQNPYKFTSNVNKTYIKWNLIYSPISCSAELMSLKSSLISASGFSDESNEGSFLMLGCSDHQNKSLYTFPGFKRIKLPKSNLKVCTFSASPTKIVLLDEDGTLFIANDWLHPRFLLGIKWEKINSSRTGSRLVDVSCNIIDQICWFIDEDGSSWIHRLKSSSWLLARDDHVPSLSLQMITVSPQNSAVVWALDNENHIYAREGIFNDKSDDDCLIGGIDWVGVEPVVGSVKLIAASLDCVWVVSAIDGDDRLFKRVGIDPPSNYVGTEWEEVLLPLLIEDQVMRISSSLSGDLYILTSNGLLYQYCIHETIPLKTVDDGWLLL